VAQRVTGSSIRDEISLNIYVYIYAVHKTIPSAAMASLGSNDRMSHTYMGVPGDACLPVVVQGADVVVWSFER
jgi:hypothetical protein